MIPIALADDHTLMREGLKRIVEEASDIRVVAEASTADEALALALGRADELAALVLDLSMPGVHGMELVRKIKHAAPQLPILVFTMLNEVEHAVQAMRAGAHGYLTKDHAGERLIGAIRKVAAGRPYITAEVAAQLAVDKGKPNDDLPHKLLSNREYEVFTLIAEGKTTSQIAEMLHLSAKTVSTHKGRVLSKMNVRSPAHLVQYAIHHKLVAATG